MLEIRQRIGRSAPGLAAIAAAVVGLINVGSTLTPNIRWRGHLLLNFEPVSAIRLFHAFALPAGAALLLVSPYLLKRRRRAWQAAILLMVILGVLDLLKGLDFEEAIVTWAAAALLLTTWRQFRVEHDPITLRSAVWRVPLLGACAIAITAVAARATEGHPSTAKVARETGDLLLWRQGPLHLEHHYVFHHSFIWLSLGIHLLEIGTLLAIAYVVFRPLAGPRALPGPAARRAAEQLVRAHGSDTLSFFKLRSDKHYFFSADRSAFVGYRIESGVLLLSGDPVGPPDVLADLLRDVYEFAHTRGLKLGAVGASERLKPLYNELGLRTMYLGDEAVVELDKFSLEGRAIRKVRQSVSRLQKAGYTAEALPVSTLTEAQRNEIEQVVELGRMGAPEKGFSMGMESISGDHDADTLVVVARDGDATVRGVLHFVPCFGRPAMSLSLMRRDPDTPNGLTEFMVVRAAELLRERGCGEMSLNFATFAKWMHSPANRLQRAQGKLASWANPFFQIESLYRFNAKFFPRWEPRYFVYEGLLDFPRTGLAAIWAEGQMPKPQLPQTLSRTSHKREQSVVARARAAR